MIVVNAKNLNKYNVSIKCGYTYYNNFPKIEQIIFLAIIIVFTNDKPKIVYIITIKANNNIKLEWDYNIILTWIPAQFKVREVCDGVPWAHNSVLWKY